MNIELDITRECNFQCPSCMRFSNLYNKNPKSIMTLEEIHNIIIELKKNNIKLHKLRIMGGEPTLHPQFKEICKLILNSNIANVYVLETNLSNLHLDLWIKLRTDIIINMIPQNININNFIKLHLPIQILKNNKIIKHFNAYNTRYVNTKKILLDNCVNLEECGITIYKYNNQIRYAKCNWSIFISRLLLNENLYTYNSLEECLNTDIKYLYSNICPLCILANKYTYNSLDTKIYKDFSCINNYFKNGYLLLIQHTEFYY